MKLLYKPLLAALATFAAATIDEHSTIPLFSAIAVGSSLVIGAALVGMRVQKILDKVEAMGRTMDRIRSERSLDSTLLLNEVVNGKIKGSGGFHILIVEDSPMDRELLTRKLQPAFIVDHAKTLTEASRLLKEEAFDCVLLDLGLPDSPKSDTVSEFTKRHPKVLCIVITGNQDPRVRKKCIESGAADVWIKGEDDKDVRTMGRKLREAIWKQ